MGLHGRDFALKFTISILAKHNETGSIFYSYLTNYTRDIVLKLGIQFQAECLFFTNSAVHIQPIEGGHYLSCYSIGGF